MKKHWALVLPLLVIGCAREDKEGIAGGVREPAVVPVPSTGSVSGQVLDTGMEPLADASVALSLGSATADHPFTAQTDAQGNFLLTGVPAGSEVLVTVSKQGYATLRTTATVPSSAGGVPLNNGNANVGALALAETQGRVSFTLVTPSGHAASGAQAYLEALPAGTLAFNGGAATALGSVVVSARADDLGVVTFTDVPAPAELARIGGVGADAGGYRLWVDPVDVNGDGIIDAAGYARKIDASTLLVYGGSQVLQLPLPRNDTGGGTDVPTASGFRLLATNMPSLTYVNLPSGDPQKAQMELQKKPVRNLVRPGEPIYLGFSQPVAKDSLLAILTDESGNNRIDLTATPSATGDVYALTPLAALVREGQEHNLILRATSAYDGTVKTWKGFFISGDPASPRPLQLASVSFKDGTSGTVGMLDPGECVILTFNQVVTPSASLQFDTLLNPGGSTPPFKAQLAAPPSANPCLAETSVTPATKFPIDTTNFNDASSRFVFT
ncbi:MAG: carboxypeptidase-like regulatory domain-containing protein, partial [Archangium sp.]